MRADALTGLQGAEKSIPPVWFYDERGSRLFEVITQLPEYYPTRAERALLEETRRLHRRAVQGRHPGGARCRSLRQDTRAALGAPRDGLAGEVRPVRRERRIPPGRRHHPVRGVRNAGHPPGHRRLPPPSRRDPDGRAADGRLSWRDDRQPDPGAARPVPLRSQLHDVERRLAAHRDGSGEGPEAARGGLRRCSRRDGRLQPQRSPRAQRTAGGRLRSANSSDTSRCGTRTSSGSRCACAPKRRPRCC